MPLRTGLLELRRRAAFGLAVFILMLVLGILMLLLGVRVGHAGEIVPSIGLTKPVNGDVDAAPYGGIAVRGMLAPMLETEIGVAYRSESRDADQLKIRMWPVTASLYLTPLPMLYAGGGVGWYQTTYDYASTLPYSDETKQEFGVHLGGGMQVPLGPRAGLDLGGRYVMMRDQQSPLIPEKFSPDFWTTSIGLALKF